MPTKPATFVADIANLANVLVEHFIKLERWVVWKWELRTRADGSEYWTKTPYQACFPKAHAKTDDPNTWGRYTDAIAAVIAGAADGIGFMLKGSDFGAVDVDHVRDPQTREILGWAKPLIAEADQHGLYREVTVSGCGLRLIGLAPSGNKLHRKLTFNRTTGAGIELYRNCERYITISGLQEGTCQTLGSIDAYLDELLNRFGPQQPPQSAYSFNFNFNSNQNDYYRDLIENGAPVGQRSEKFQQVVWHLASGGWSIDQIVDELAQYPNGIGQKYAGRLHDEVTRSFVKWQAQRHANVVGAGANTGTSTGANPSLTPWPQIRIIAGELPRVVDEAEEALPLLGREIYQRGNMIVRPVLNQSLKASSGQKTASWQLIEVTQPYLVEMLCCAAQFLRWDKRVSKFVAVDAPDKIAKAYLNRQGRWKLPLISGVVNTPFLRADGSICETPGYDPASYVLFKPENQVFPPVPQRPSKGDAIAALETLRNLISTFPFVGNADRAVMLAAMLTVLDRRSMRSAPLIGFSKPMARTGASLLVNLLGILATGRSVPVMAQGKSKEEFEKGFKASLLAADVCISIDNCMQPLSGDLLCQALTEDEMNIRILGFSRNIRTETIATIFATGNNLIVADDMTDRCLLCSLDAKVERPELRKFKIDVIEETRTKRGELVVAVLTILCAWHLARDRGERVKIDPLGGFTDWTQRVREPLIWLGEGDPCDTIAKLHENDPVQDELEAVLVQWKEKLGTGLGFEVHDLIARAVVEPSFYHALVIVAASRDSNIVSPERLGWWLRRMQGRIVQGLRIERAGKSHGHALWKLVG